jgi:8-amino-7-oxononanoate synthase
LGPAAFWDEELLALEQRDLLREPVPIDGLPGPRVVRGGRTLLNFSSNDYLSLAGDLRVRGAAARAAERFGAGAGASRLLGGDLPIHRELEVAIAELKGTATAMLFSSGFAANVGVIPALVDEGDAVFSDALNHASIIDGCRLSRAQRLVYRHLDVDQLGSMLAASSARRKLIVTETLFSMDGDVAPVRELCELAERHGAMLMVDEAHATGVYGEGAGFCRELGVSERVAIQMGTLSKALGSSGAYVAGERKLIQFLLNRARSYVFSTAPNPASCGAALESLRVIRSAEGARLRTALLSRAAELADALRSRHLPLIGGNRQLMAVRVSAAKKAMAAGARLEELGVFVRAVRPPTVPEGTSRLRICLQSGHAAEDIAALAGRLADVLGDAPPT